MLSLSHSSLKPDARAPSQADFRQIDQSPVRETAPNRRKPFPCAMAVNSNLKKKTALTLTL
jgi:hypothetical protein